LSQEFNRLWQIIEDHQRQLNRLRHTQQELCEENAALLDALECTNHAVGMRLSAQLHRRRFAKILKRFPLQPATALVRVIQTPGIIAAASVFSGLPAVGRLAAVAQGFHEAADAVLAQMARSLRRRKIYVIGGAQSNQALNVVECFDPEGNQWTALAPMPTPRSDLAAAAVGGKLYAIGGYDGRTLSAVELFDPSSNVWETLAPMPTPRSDFVAAAEAGCVYRLGGLDEYYEALDTLERFDPVTKAWEVLKPMRIPRWSFAVAVIAGRLYAIGGFADGQALSVVERFDPSNGLWEVLSPMPTARSAFAAAVVGHKVYVFGGSCPGVGRALAVAECYDPETDRWSSLALMPTPRSRFAAAALAGRIYCFGGVDDTGGSPECRRAL